MHSDVNATIEQSVVDFLGEQTLATDVREGLVENLVTRRLDNDNLQCTFLAELRETSLQDDRGG